MKTDKIIFGFADDWASVDYDMTNEATDEKELCFLFCDYLIRKGIMSRNEFDTRGKKIFNMTLRRKICQE